MTSPARVLDDLKLDAVVFLGAPWLASSCGRLFVQIANVRVAHERFAMIAAARTWLRWMVLEPMVKQLVRAGE
jgi:hypothetical protein